MKQQILLFGITLVLLAVGFSGCTQEDTSTDVLGDLGWSNTEHGIGLNPPEDWTVDDPDSLGGIVRFYGPIENEIQISLGITGPDNMGSGTLNGMADQVIALYPDYFENFSLISSNAKTINGLDGWEIVYNLSLMDSVVIQKQIMVEKNKDVYTLTWGPFLSESYDSYDSVIEQSTNSFTIA